MKAALLKSFGGPEAFELCDVPKPVPQAGQVLVRVHATSINPLDYQVRRGDYSDLVPLPTITGHDVSGVVEEVGPGVTAFSPGDEVWYTPQIFDGPGSYAEYHVAAESIIGIKPPSLSHLEAASLTLVGGTAWEALAVRAALRVGESILIHGGGGGSHIFQQITDVFPGQEIIDRTLINTWEDQKVVDAVKATGRKQLIIAGLWTEICVAMPAIQAAGEGWDVTVITDACGGVSVEAHEVAIQRMAAAGINLMTWLALASEWQRDWARADTAGALTDVLIQHAAGSGIAYLWEQQLLDTPVPSTVD